MGSKHDVLTRQEMEAFSINPLFSNAFERYTARTRFARESCRILDWGCGRGRLVAALLAQGYDAYGIDVDTLPLQNGLPYFRECGYDPQLRLKLWELDTSVPFTENSFDAIVSNQVLEHVSDLDQVAREIARLLKPGGISLHIWPAHRRIVEPHLFMPFVHWLPKNRLRQFYIQTMIRLGVEPRWPELEGENLIEKTSVYFDYSVAKTYYRPPRLVQAIFEHHGLHSEVFGLGATRFSLLNRALRKLNLLNWYAMTFRTLGMRVDKQ